LPPLPLLFLLGFGCLLRKSSMVASTRSPYFLTFVLKEHVKHECSCRYYILNGKDYFRKQKMAA
jgi:hypothetical protein